MPHSLGRGPGTGGSTLVFHKTRYDRLFTLNGLFALGMNANGLFAQGASCSGCRGTGGRACALLTLNGLFALGAGLSSSNNPLKMRSSKVDFETSRAHAVRGAVGLAAEHVLASDDRAPPRDHRPGTLLHPTPDTLWDLSRFLFLALSRSLSLSLALSLSPTPLE